MNRDLGIQLVKILTVIAREMKHPGVLHDHTDLEEVEAWVEENAPVDTPSEE